MDSVCTIGLDIAKNVFQVHGVDAEGGVVLVKKLKRDQLELFFAQLPRCVIGIEASGSAYHWARLLAGLGHDARLIHPRLVKAFVLNNKTDAADARAICEVVKRPSTIFVPLKSVDQQAMSAMHCIRERRIQARISLIHQIRSLLAELGIVYPPGVRNIVAALPMLIDVKDTRIPCHFKAQFVDLHEELHMLDLKIAAIDSLIRAMAQSDQRCKRLLKIPGVGILTATALVAHYGDARQFKNGRHFAASLGLTPREFSSGGRQRLGGITKRGNPYIRRLLVQGARVLCHWWCAKEAGEHEQNKLWLQTVSSRRGQAIASVAQANKTARIAWHILAREEEYRDTQEILHSSDSKK